MFSFRLTFFVHCYYYNVFLYYHLFVPAVRSSDGPRKRTNEKMVGTATRHLDEFKINCLHQFTKKELNEHAVAQWNYQVNKTEATEHEAMRSSIRLFIYQKLLVTSAENMSVAFGMSYEDLLPLVYFVHDRGICQLNTDEYKTTLMLKRKLKTTINELTVCEYRKTNHPCDVTADEINVIMASSSDAIELKYYWKAWHNHTSYDVKNIYMNYIEMLNYMARLNRFSNEVDYYMEPYNSHNQGQLNADQMYEGIRPLYLHLYTHVRKILREKFGTATVSANGPIPVHLLGSVLGQPWTKLIPFMVQEFVVHESGKTHSMTPAKRLFDQANRFFVSIGMGCVPKSVWSHSVWKDNKHFSNRQPSSWDLYANNDFRIKMDVKDTVEDVYTMHKQLGLVHYFAAYKNQPIAYQHTSNPAFVYGVINALTLSVRYQDFIGRYNDSASSRSAYLLRLAMEKVAVLPFAYAADVWHSEACTSSFAPKRMNDHWWSKRLKYEGVVSPISKDMDKCMNPNYKPFDPSAAYAEVIELPHIKDFLGPIIEFQVFKALCTICGEYKSKHAKTKHLYECNLRGYKKVGKIIKSVMASGSSVEWKFLFETIVGHRRVEIEPLLEYFQPLHNHLLKTNQETNEHIGWK
ncbi:angiotensin-converting enzyme isoform X1 [Acyrthosiphon pisum]|uniref:Angiotensin-converting enzyme n=2 Tax=Acyrthosiphon pisum TaxID=7029 RepID=A0A8R2A747_ACYPI|nr:angiotensin-converting enzyme isoform X1 [Acyrthosiphon pisum]XP_008187283.1 angiotensin-converting enzyme isoform X1 [Acyrthosiphon pisum]|eukprot:XP_001948448.3 PREDICTED: angiotensin-converting enzyme-like isoform X1 [Acyrthosiphon pisum]